jgi:hypothetical protein
MKLPITALRGTAVVGASAFAARLATATTATSVASSAGPDKVRPARTIGTMRRARYGPAMVGSELARAAPKARTRKTTVAVATARK